MNEFIARYRNEKVAKAVVENTIAKLDTVTEGYVGKTANLVKIEELFNDIIADVYRTAGEGASAMDRIYTARKMNINKDPRIEKIRQLYAKEFNFAKFDMTVASTKDPNAYTYVMSKFTRTSISKLPELPTKHGEKYIDKSKQYVCYVFLYSSLFANLTGGEITAIILHEIGHNFDMATKSWFGDWLGQLITEESADFEEWKDKMIPRIVKDTKKDLADEAKEYENDTEEPVWERRFDTIFKYIPLGKIIMTAFCAVMAPLTWLNAKFDAGSHRALGAEVYSDSFATAYGYGAEISSGLMKFEDADWGSGASSTKAGTVSYLLGTFPFILMSYMDPHPTTQSRITRQMNDLKKLMDDPNTPPTTKKLVERDYLVVKKVYDQYLEGNGSTVRSFIRKIQDKYFKGSFDIRGYALKINALTDRDEAEDIIGKK